MEKEKILLNFYREFIALSQKNLKRGSNFFNQAVISMILGHEFNIETLCSKLTYEKLLLLNLSYNNLENIIGDLDSVHQLLGPFLLINQNEYYVNVLLDNFVLNREILMIRKLEGDLKTQGELSFIRSLLDIKHHNLVDSFFDIFKLNEIYRKGWIKRNVLDEYWESDATHTMQMMAFASAYFCFYDDTNLNQNKILDMIMIHEVGEILADDIVEGDPKHNKKHEIEYESIKNVFSSLERGDYFISLWEEFEQRETKEAKFTYELDKLDPILKAQYLDSALDREDLFEDFFMFEKKRNTFENSKFKKLVYCLEQEMLKK